MVNEMANDEMLEGYRDGANLDSPEPSANRTAAYRHGFANGRDDLRRAPRALAPVLRAAADKAEKADANA